MKVLILLCFVAGALASCPANSHYESCGTACPLTCKNYQNPPRACILICNPGCHCDEGYVKTEDGQCVLPEQCPNSAGEYDEEKTCFGEPDGGMCRGYFPMYHFDTESGTCKEFIYGGCGGNGNRYGSEEECLQRCGGQAKPKHSSTDLCELPAEIGMCRGYFPRYHFDKASGQCKEFIYGGCGGNENNFKTLEACNGVCASKGVCGANQRYTGCGTACPLTCDNYQNPPKICNLMCYIGCECEDGYVKAADGSCVLPENCPSRALNRPDCDKPAETGLCRAYIPRFYYDQEAGMCKKFIYGGCGGNKNNFATEDECYNKCGALAPVNTVCEQEKEVGPCRAAFRKYFFNKQTGQCEQFIYGGCLGNSNRFNTKSECESVCVA